MPVFKFVNLALIACLSVAIDECIYGNIRAKVFVFLIAVLISVISYYDGRYSYESDRVEKQN